jgi:hypothetical protein
MRFSLLIPATFVAALLSGTALAERGNEDNHATRAPRSEHNQVLRERYAHRSHTVDRVRHERVRHDRQRVRNQRADPRVNCGDDSCGHAPHGVVASNVHGEGHATRERRAATLNSRALERVNCAPTDDTCGTSRTVTRHSDSAKGDKASHHMTKGQLAAMKAAFMRLVEKACAQRAHEGCGVGGGGGSGN